MAPARGCHKIPMRPIGFEILSEEGPCLVVLQAGRPRARIEGFGIDSMEVRIKAFLKEPRTTSPAAAYLGLHAPARPLPSRGAMGICQTRPGCSAAIQTVRTPARSTKRGQRRSREWSIRLEEPGATFSGKAHGQPHALSVDESHPGGRPAVLHYRTLGRHRVASWLENFGWKRAGLCTRFACKRPRRKWDFRHPGATRTTVRKFRSASSSPTSDCGRLPTHMRVGWAFCTSHDPVAGLG